MKFVTHRHPDGTLRAGELRNDNIYSYAPNLALTDLITMMGDGEILPQPVSREEAANANLRAPLRPGKIIAVGRNYAEHAAELNNAVPEKPLLFSKYSTSVIGPGEPIRWRPSITAQVDWEGELAVVIGRRGRDIDEARAEDYIFGYTIANDVSARDLQTGDGQWTRAKGMDTFCPLGPVVVTRDEIADPHDLTVQTTVSGTLMQDGNTSDMIYRIPYLIAYCSQVFTLEPGDILLTGTPSGVGKAQKPPRFLGAGDEVRITISSIGTLVNPCSPLE